MEITFYVEIGTQRPIYRQLVDQARRRVMAGCWQPGQEVPSVRDAARALVVNPMTVSKAYKELEVEGVFVRRRGRSMVVAQPPESGAWPAAASASARLELLRPEMRHAARAVDDLGVPHASAVRLFGHVLKEAR